MNRLLYILSVVLIGLGAFQAKAQEPGHRQCAADALHRHSPNRSHYSGGEAFEAWLQKVEAEEMDKSVQDNNELYYIPVVFHILYNGESYGTDRNILDVRITDQIDILNNDYTKLFGTPGFNSHPAGADSRIRFCRAAVNPSGLPTTGIVRVNTTQAEFSISSDNSVIKGYSLWDPNRYLNVWVCKLSNFDLGYAQFPYTDSLQFNGVVDVQPDGVVIDYRAFGNVPVGQGYASYNMGRTATHEIGHYLGLLHIWGDGMSCSDPLGTDFCTDTPKQANYTSGCPATIPASCDGSTPTMRENYMDYTNDACMNIFTNDQKRRMRVVMRNAPRRKTLFTTPTQCGVTSREALAEEKEWLLFPNPASGELIVKSNSGVPPGKVEIRDVTGKLCLSMDFGNELQKTISLEALLNGVYIASMVSRDGKISYRKFVKN